MITISEAFHIIDNQKFNLPKLEVSLLQATGCYLVEDFVAPMDLPPFDNSAMDGYVIADIGDKFEVAGEIQAGDINRYRIPNGQTYRIFTGARVPENATAVVMQEHVEEREGIVNFERESISAGQHIRKKGEQVKKGNKVLPAGTLLNPAAIGLIATFGIEQVSIYKKPGIALLTTGDELVEPGTDLPDGKIYESNSYALKSALQQLGYSIDKISKVPDDYDFIKVELKHLINNYEVVLISGGISVGKYDFVKAALEALDVNQLFYRVHQKPGKPPYFGRKDNTAIFALPGNPASSLTCLYLYVYRLLQKRSGRSSDVGLSSLKLPLIRDYEMKFNRPTFLKASFSVEGVEILDGQASSMLWDMATGNCLAYIENEGFYQKGSHILVYITS